MSILTGQEEHTQALLWLQIRLYWHYGRPVDEINLDEPTGFGQKKLLLLLPVAQTTQSLRVF